MVCSPGRAPTQSQLVHFQRSNVAMSRARDQCILVRSIDISDIPSTDDVKIPIIEFFQKAATTHKRISSVETDTQASEAPFTMSKNSLRQLLNARLMTRGYKTCCMGVVWNDGICVEHPDCDERVALIIDDVSETYQDWVRSYRQQQKIEAVGWKCLRVDVLSFLSDCNRTMQSIFEFLKQVGIFVDEEKNTKMMDSYTAPIETMPTPDTELTTQSTLQGGANADQCDKNAEKESATRNESINKATRTKRARTNRTSKLKQHVDLNDSIEDVESLISIDSQSNSNDGNIVVDLSFLRGR
jgi:hypothetical protein